ncbi:fumarate hydratase [Desulfurobacterium atlanticum]|uniref:Fumarase, class I alpha subunit n=1 Tax=Desulfurobacterium atlanticum TaxID=240169 RepID=A0A238YLN0_9BACT|nr:fumarate hydratase [Desulfurobacterium atlanticum]SNR71902.1 fumarase, class I alpha subunit [Desulfurobacterium atlanticum]
MRKIDVKEIKEAVKRLCMEANYYLPEDVLSAFDKGIDKEVSPVGKNVLEILKENASIAASNQVPYCQDTGFAVFFVEIGQDVQVVGGDINEAIEEGVAEGYTEGYLRKSIVSDPLFDRRNTGNNTPPIIHYNVVPGDRLKIKMAAKGGGSENMSRLAMLKPADGVEGVKKFVLETVSEAGPNPCPPIIVGIGIGGTFEKVAYLAKKSLMRPIGDRNKDPRYAALEEELLEKINKLGIGPAGFGGKVTALDVKIEWYPCHIASLPVAVNIQCHASRHKEIEL